MSEGAALFLVGRQQRPRGVPGALTGRCRFARARQLVAQGRENIDIDALGSPRTSGRRASTTSATATAARASRSASRRTSATSSTSSGTSRSISARCKTDYNIYVFDADGHFIDPNDPTSDAFFTDDDNTATDQAIELMAVNPGTYQIVIAKVNDGPADVIKYVTVNGTGESEIQNAPSIWGHAAARHGQAVAAMYYAIPKFPGGLQLAGAGRRSTSTRRATVSMSRKSATSRRSPRPTASTPRSSGGDIDGNGQPNFFGTSAAAPDAAAVGALVIQAAGGPGHIEPARRLRAAAANRHGDSAVEKSDAGGRVRRTGGRRRRMAISRGKPTTGRSPSNRSRTDGEERHDQPDAA